MDDLHQHVKTIKPEMQAHTVAKDIGWQYLSPELISDELREEQAMVMPNGLFWRTEVREDEWFGRKQEEPK